MNVRRHRRSNIQNRLPMRPRLRLQDLRPRDLRRDRRPRKAARRVSRQARSLPMPPNLKTVGLTVFGPYFFKLL